MKIKRIFYLGNDDIFFSKLNSRFKECFPSEKTDAFHYRIKKGINWKFEWPKVFKERIPHLIFIDFTNLDLSDKQNIDLLWSFVFFRKNKFLRGIPLIALFSKEEEMYNCRFLCSMGFLYTYLKREIDKTIYEDSFYLAFEMNNMIFDKYAKARFEIPYHLYSCSSISSFNIGDILVETDLSGNVGDSFHCHFNLFDDFNIKKFEVVNSDNYSKVYNYTRQLEFRIPYLNPWDEMKNESIEEATMETWVEFNRRDFYKRYPHVLVLQSELDIYLKITSLAQYSDFCLDVRDYIDGGFKMISASKPKIIFFSLDGTRVENGEVSNGKKEDDYLPNDINTLGQIISFIKTFSGYEPVVVIFNSKSSTSALRKAYLYEKIMAFKGQMTVEDVDNLLKIYQINQKSEMLTENYFFSPFDKRRVVDIRFDVVITSLTEHEITFMTHQNLPIYTILKLDEPAEIMLTVIPTVYDLEGKEGMNHYTALIHGVPEETLQTLRIFVNQMIFDTPKEFKYNKISEISSNQDADNPQSVAIKDKEAPLNEEEKNREKQSEDMNETKKIEKEKEEIIKMKTIDDIDPDRFKVKRKKSSKLKSKL